MTTSERRGAARSFVFRGGTRIAETVISCDATSGGDVLFLSNARALDRSPRRRGRPRVGRGQILATAETLALLGAEGDRLRARTLLVAAGRPFSLGTLRLELLPSGHLPGAAVLSCETETRRILYAGAARLGAPAWGAAVAGVRAADALCIDATFGHPRFTFVSRDEASAAACAFAGAARAAGCAPVILSAPLGPAQDVAPALAEAGWRLRGHRTILAAAAGYRRAGISLPPMARLSGPLAADEVLLWPTTARAAGQLAQLGPARVAWLSGWAADAALAEQMGRPNTLIPYSSHADCGGLMAYVSATGAREVAVINGFAEDFAATLRERDIDAYVLGPPRQTSLFGGEH